MTEAQVQLFNKDALEFFNESERSRVHMILADPPYGFAKMNMQWKASDRRNITVGQTVKNLTAGMAFKPEQASVACEQFLSFARGMRKIIVPGGFCIIFASPRLSHGYARALELCGFAIRDSLIWLHNEGHFKAASLSHFGLHTSRRVPQPRPMFETIILAQALPPIKLTQLWTNFKTGLMAERNLKNESVSNTFVYAKPSAAEKTAGGNHPTQKPVELLKDLIHCFSIEGQVVCDPFMGSGSTGCAAQEINRDFIGVEIDPQFFNIASKRLKYEMKHD